MHWFTMYVYCIKIFINYSHSNKDPQSIDFLNSNIFSVSSYTQTIFEVSVTFFKRRWFYLLKSVKLTSKHQCVCVCVHACARMHMCVCVHVSHSVMFDSLSVEFSKQEHWSGLPFPSPGDLPNPGIKPGPPALQADPIASESPGQPSK